MLREQLFLRTRKLDIDVSFGSNLLISRIHRTKVCGPMRMRTYNLRKYGDPCACTSCTMRMWKKRATRPGNNVEIRTLFPLVPPAIWGRLPRLWQ